MFQPINLLVDCLKFGTLTQQSDKFMPESIGGNSSWEKFTRLQMGTEATVILGVL